VAGLVEELRVSGVDDGLAGEGRSDPPRNRVEEEDGAGRRDDLRVEAAGGLLPERASADGQRYA
jgi:hypothetical protein